MITYQVEDYSECVGESWLMLQAHYDEICTDKHVKPLDPDYERYEKLNELGMLRVFTVRDDGVMVGYFVSVVAPGLHYQQTMMALNDIMYLEPKYRGGTVGFRLVKLAVEDLKNLGADILTIHMKTDYPFRSLLNKLGFHLTEENWEKVLSDESQPQRTPR